VNGAGGDPDGDGVSNADERTPARTRAASSGASSPKACRTRSSRRVWPALNLSTNPAHVQFRFLRPSGAPVTHEVTIPARARISVDPGSVTGVYGNSFSTVVESDVPVVVDRTVSWDRPATAATPRRRSPRASTTWFLAEGATHGSFDLFYLIQNPGPTAAP
jgi:hypothetical protein